MKNEGEYLKKEAFENIMKLRRINNPKYISKESIVNKCVKSILEKSEYMYFDGEKIFQRDENKYI